jgi:hypothetical protein
MSENESWNMPDFRRWSREFEIDVKQLAEVDGSRQVWSTHDSKRMANFD